MTLLFGDYLIFSISIIIGLLFILLGTDKVYRFYIGVIFGFLFFLVLNLEIKVLNLEGSLNPLFWEDFLLKNKDFVLSLSTALIPIFGLLFIAFSKISKNNIFISLLFGLLFPIFLLGIFIFILNNTAFELQFLGDILSKFRDGFIFQIFDKNTHYIFLLLFFVVFWRFIFTFIFGIIGLFISWLSSKEKDEK